MNLLLLQKKKWLKKMGAACNFSRQLPFALLPHYFPSKTKVVKRYWKHFHRKIIHVFNVSIRPGPFLGNLGNLGNIGNSFPRFHFLVLGLLYMTGLKLGNLGNPGNLGNEFPRFPRFPRFPSFRIASFK